MVEAAVSYICRYCKREYEPGMTLNTAYLIEHLLREHPDKAKELENFTLKNIVFYGYDIKEAGKGRAV